MHVMRFQHSAQINMDETQFTIYSSLTLGPPQDDHIITEEMTRYTSNHTNQVSSALMKNLAQYELPVIVP